MHPQTEEKVDLVEDIFAGGLKVGVVNLVNLAVLAYLSRATTKEVINLFRKKVHPAEKILSTPIGCRSNCP